MISAGIRGRTLTNIANFRHDPVRGFELKRLERLPYLQDLLRRQRDEIRDTPQKLVRDCITPLPRVRILATRYGEYRVCHKQRRNGCIRWCRMQTLTARKVTSTDHGSQTGQELGRGFFEQFQGCTFGRWVCAVGPDGVDFGHVDRAVERCGPVCPGAEDQHSMSARRS